ncbi:hypothetical protein [Cerasicoccus frondis]|uniref:hypothetical protein n=1 Tax=Cerasicoccus frondis TaxID=490090 RepID=UPI0028529DCF|nr:hypothetical protein [Cerasicoccus frondis]
MIMVSQRIPVRLTSDEYALLDGLKDSYRLSTRTDAMKKAIRVAMAYQFEDPEAILGLEFRTRSTRPFVFRVNALELKSLNLLWRRFAVEHSYKLRCALHLSAMRKGIVYDKSTQPV